MVENSNMMNIKFFEMKKNIRQGTLGGASMPEMTSKFEAQTDLTQRCFFSKISTFCP